MEKKQELQKVEQNKPLRVLSAESIISPRQSLSEKVNLIKQEAQKKRLIVTSDKPMLSEDKKYLLDLSAPKIEAIDKRVKYQLIRSQVFRAYTLTQTKLREAQNSAGEAYYPDAEQITDVITAQSWRFKNLSTEEFKTAITEGALGEYGEQFGISAKIIYEWIKSYTAKKKTIEKRLIARYRNMANQPLKIQLYDKIITVFDDLENKKNKELLSYEIRLLYDLFLHAKMVTTIMYYDSYQTYYKNIKTFKTAIVVKVIKGFGYPEQSLQDIKNKLYHVAKMAATFTQQPYEEQLLYKINFYKKVYDIMQPDTEKIPAPGYEFIYGLLFCNKYTEFKIPVRYENIKKSNLPETSVKHMSNTAYTFLQNYSEEEAKKLCQKEAERVSQIKLNIKKRFSNGKR